MNGIMFIFSDLLQLTGCDPWQAQCIETLTLLFTLLMTAVVCVLMGCGVPTTANYIIMVAVAAPVSLSQ